MAGIRSPRWFCGNLWVPPTTALLQRGTALEAYLSGYPPVSLLDATNIYDAEEKGNRLTALNAGLALTMVSNHRVGKGNFEPAMVFSVARELAAKRPEAGKQAACWTAAPMAPS